MLPGAKGQNKKYLLKLANVKEGKFYLFLVRKIKTTRKSFEFIMKKNLKKQTMSKKVDHLHTNQQQQIINNYKFTLLIFKIMFLII